MARVHLLRSVKKDGQWDFSTYTPQELMSTYPSTIICPNVATFASNLAGSSAKVSRRWPSQAPFRCKAFFRTSVLMFLQKSKGMKHFLLYLIIVEHSNWNQTTCTLQLKCWESSMKTCHLGGLHTDRLVDLFWRTACWKQFHSVHTSLAAKKWTNSHWNGMTLIIRSHTNFLAVAVETNTHPRSPNGTSMTLGVNFAGDKFSALSSCT